MYDLSFEHGYFDLGFRNFPRLDLKNVSVQEYEIHRHAAEEVASNVFHIHCPCAVGDEGFQRLF